MRGLLYALIISVVVGVVAHDALAQTRGATPARGTAPAPAGAARGTAPARPSAGAGPILVFETAKGSIEIETYPVESPKSVEHILALVKRNFYNGLRIHRVEPGFVVQFGDPQTRDMTKKALWGTRGSGQDIGVSEATRKRIHVLGAVALAHAGDPRAADSQMYITMAPVPRLDGKFTVIGQVISGMEVVSALRVNDVIRRATVKAPATATK